MYKNLYKFCENGSQSIIKQAFQKYYKHNDLLTGVCSAKYSQIYRNRNKQIHENNWKFPLGLSQKLYLSSLGVGTQSGSTTLPNDLKMFQSLINSINSGGINIIDTCPSYRYGRSQKILNAVLNYLIDLNEINRQELFISTKCGYIEQDIDSNYNEQKIINLMKNQLSIPEEDILQRTHCIHPNYIEFSIKKSRISIGIQTIDLVYLNNYSQNQLSYIGYDNYLQKLKLAFIKLEELRSLNLIKYYGICSFIGLRSSPNQIGIYTSLQQMIKIAKDVAGQNHGFRFLMVPASISMPEIFMLKWQKYSYQTIHIQKESEQIQTKQQYHSLLQAAALQNINVISCMPLFGGRLPSVPFANGVMNNLNSNSARHLQLIRSISSKSLLSTVLSQNTPSHVEQNIELLKYAKLNLQQWRTILTFPQDLC